MFKKILTNTAKDTHTYKAGLLILNDFKKFFRIFKYCSLIFTTIYFIYALTMQIGNTIANIILASLFVLYTTFDIATHKLKIRKTKKVVKRSYKWLKLGIKAFTLGSMLYGLYTATTSVNPISIILATLMIIFWVLQILLELIIEVVEDKWQLLSNSLKQDVEDIKDNFKENFKNSLKETVSQSISNVSSAIQKPVKMVSNAIKSKKSKDIENKEQLLIALENNDNNKKENKFKLFKKKN